jgi:hypothetical protein
VHGLDWLGLPNYVVLIGPIALWFLVRFGEFFLEYQNPRDYSFGWSHFSYLLYIVKFALIVLFIALGVLLMAKSEQPEVTQPEVTPGLLVSVFWVAIFALSWLWLRNKETSLELEIQFQKLKPRDEHIRNGWLESVRFLKWVCLVWGGLTITRHLPVGLMETLRPWVSHKFSQGLTLAFYILVGLIILYMLVGLLFLLVRFLEYREDRHFSPATRITPRDTPLSVYEREDSGVNKYQNHLASLTYVKPGIIRAVLLRLTLLIIGLLARFKFNQGELGGIQTILAARWVIIKGGKSERLLFLSNYLGSLESYLNEFIDMGAVKGLNAIWSNTFASLLSNGTLQSNTHVKPADCEPGYAFPTTKFIFQKGAQAEKPFKAYVRRSQIETIVWYSAYPTLATVNINANSDLRQALFKPSAPYELDSIFLKAGL